MPMIVSKKQRIFFTIEGERGPFLLLHHGLFGSHHDWYEWGFVKALARDYRLVIPDARGHGRSDKPLAVEQYRLSSFSDDLIEILNELDIRNVNLIGYSLGAVIGFDLLSRHSGRVRGAVLGGEAPLVGEAAQQCWADLAARLETESLSDLVRKLCDENALACSQPGFSEDPINESAPAMLQAMREWTTNDAEKIHVRSPLALFCGKDEPGKERIEQVRGRISSARILPLESATTAEAMREPQALLREIVEFLKNEHGTPERDGAANPRRGSGGPGRKGGSSRRDSATPASEESAPGTEQSPAVQPQADTQVESPRAGGGGEATAAEGAAQQPATEDAAQPAERTATGEQEQPREDNGAAEREPGETGAGTAASSEADEPERQPGMSGTGPEDEKDSQKGEEEA